MPYIAVKAYPRDAETKQRAAEELQQVIVKHFGCPPQAVTISFEDIQPEDWENTVVKPEIEPKLDKMFILKGEKKY